MKSPNVKQPSPGSKPTSGLGGVQSWDRGINNVKSERPSLSKPSLNQPALDQAAGKGQVSNGLSGKPTVKNNAHGDVIKPGRGKNDNTLGGARPGEALIKPANGGNPQVLQGFKPGRLQPNGKSSDASDGARDPQSVVGLQNRNVESGDAPPRQRVNVNNQQVVYNNKNVIQANSCGHSFCNGRSACAYAYDYCPPVSYGGCNYGYGNNCYNNSGWSFAIGYSGGNWGFGVGYSNYGCGSNWGVGIGYSNWYNDCNYYLPVYSYCGAYPYYRYNTWCSQVYYAQPYYCRPYYSLRYAYGCYTPSYPCYSAYAYPAYGNYWWLYDAGASTYSYSSEASYSDGYGDGFSQGYEAANSQADYGTTSHQPTWLAESHSTASETPTYAPSATPPAGSSNAERQVAQSKDGWDLLTAGDAREARRAFDRETLNNPGDGLPQIGYAITAGLLERYDDAVVAMRKALTEDPDAFNEAPRNPQIAKQIRNLLTHYRNVNRENPKDADALFMTAALRHLLGEDALAYYAIDKAIEAGDADKSANLLKGLIQRSLDAQPEAQPSAEQSTTTPAVAPMPAPTEPATAPAGEQLF